MRKPPPTNTHTTTHATPTTFSTEVFIAISSGTSSYPLSGIYDIQFELLDSDDELVFTKSYTTSISLGVLTLTVEEDDDLDLTLFYDSIVSIRITISDPSILS